MIPVICKCGAVRYRHELKPEIPSCDLFLYVFIRPPVSCVTIILVEASMVFSPSADQLSPSATAATTTIVRIRPTVQAIFQKIKAKRKGK